MYPMSTPCKFWTFLNVCFEEHVSEMLGKESHEDTAALWVWTKFGSGKKTVWLNLGAL